MNHGLRAYVRGCRCDVCSAANAARNRRQRARRLAAGTISHGTEAGYADGCRCLDCYGARQARYAVAEGYRPHWWRVMVMETYESAVEARRSLRESKTMYMVGSGGVTGSQLEDDEFNEIYPTVTLRGVLEGLRGGYGPNLRRDYG